MTYREICQYVHTRAQLQGVFSSVSEAGINGEIAALVSSTWEDIQKLRKDWLFMRKDLSKTLTVGTKEFAISDLFTVSSDSDVSRWRQDYGAMRLTDPDTGKTFFLPYLNQDALIQKYINSTENARPVCWSFDPTDLTLLFSSPLDKAYAMVAGYYRTVQVLGSTDTPDAEEPHIYPADWHNLIAYKALCDFSAAKSVIGLNQKYEVKYATGIGELLRVYCPARKVQLHPLA